ncbi:MAG: hypothetical protein IJY47_05605 [Clostridia bacterium]|nr:hypothetical protein [Clostridia bacterium]
MNEELKRDIFELSGIMSVSGFESLATEKIRERYQTYFDEIQVDAVGNHLLRRSCGRTDAPSILVDAHFDEIGMMVTKICEGGFLRFTSVGGLSQSVLQGADVVIYGTRTLRGIITSTPPHLRGDSEDILPEAEELLIDVGYPEEELEKIAPVGTPIGFAPRYRELAGGALAGKSFDNKACGAIAAYAIAHTPRENLAGDVTLLLSAFEETSRIGGVAPGAFSANPDYAMVIDVNLARVPHTPKSETVPLRGGVSLAWSAATHRELTAMTKALCQEKEIPHVMVAAPSSTGTNSPTLNLVGSGIPVVDVGLPLRNMHTYYEVIAPEDADALCRLVQAFIESPALAERFGGRKEELPT